MWYNIAKYIVVSCICSLGGSYVTFCSKAKDPNRNQIKIQRRVSTLFEKTMLENNIQRIRIRNFQLVQKSSWVGLKQKTILKKRVKLFHNSLF